LILNEHKIEQTASTLYPKGEVKLFLKKSAQRQEQAPFH
jgi:hypothetical protein